MSAKIITTVFNKRKKCQMATGKRSAEILPAIQAKFADCPNCGARVSALYITCPLCGTNLRKKTPPAAPDAK